MIGFDIGTYSLKAIELQKRDNLFTLLSFKTQDRQPQEALSVSLKKFLEDAKFSSRELNIAVSGYLVLSRIIELPEMNNSELTNAVKFEVEKFIPFNIEDAILDYQVILKSPEVKKITVLLAAAKKDFVKEYVDVFSKLGFIIKVMDVDGIALTNAFLNAHPEKKEETYDKAFVLLDVGDTVLNMSVVYKGIPFVLRDITGSGKDISEVISKGLGVDKKEAYQLKHNPPSDKQELIFELMRPTLSRFAREIRLSIGYFENQFSKGVDAIYLSGGSSRLFGLKEFLAESLDIQIEFWDPFIPITVGKDVSVKSLEAAKPELAVCVGLAIRDD